LKKHFFSKVFLFLTIKLRVRGAPSGAEPPREEKNVAFIFNDDVNLREAPSGASPLGSSGFSGKVSQETT
jgi:hypothetical protein